MAQSPLEIRSDGARSRSASATLGSLECARFTSSSLASLLLLLSRPASGDPGVAQWLVNFRVDPQTVQEHRELSRHGHRRPFLGVLAAARGDLFSVTPEVRVFREGAKDVVSATDQEPPQHLIAFLGDAPLRISIS